MEKYLVSKIKLYEELKRRGVTPAAASRELGFTDGYIAHAANNGEISARAALYLEKFYSIKPEDYQPDLLDMVDKTKPETPERIPSELIQNAAVTFARVLVEQYRETYRQTLKDAILDALKERNV